MVKGSIFLDAQHSAHDRCAQTRLRELLRIQRLGGIGEVVQLNAVTRVRVLGIPLERWCLPQFMNHQPRVISPRRGIAESRPLSLNRN